MTSIIAAASSLTPSEIKSQVPYHYIPTEWICALFVTLFSITGIIHVAEACIFRMWWLLPTAGFACVAEVIGWAGRLWSTKNPELMKPFLMQITTTILAPTPLVAANFVILGRIIERLGSQYSRLGPGLYTLVFCSCDVIALIVQAIGGGAASEAANQHRNANKGGNIMLGGIAFQLGAICIYVVCALEFFIRYHLDRPVRKARTRAQQGSSTTLGEHGGPPPIRGTVDRRLSMMIFGLGLSTLLIFIRSIYRTIELSNGWSGRIISTQVYFNVLDGGMITLASFTLNFLHPGFLLGPSKALTDSKLEQEPKRESCQDNA
ncbi:RTA1 like protein [Neolentinus lepideus HHB14362 ss-1]|uniref:RTA1 like protein n=1 Tax=Neolentinus lepideus HHB14362 ss-1 TaxID=1314782 RepID=A0A165W298_9AGAM|nr:RTA1 like protein [Neolentinus lepideus HHB14362 ss-1]